MNCAIGRNLTLPYSRDLFRDLVVIIVSCSNDPRAFFPISVFHPFPSFSSFFTQGTSMGVGREGRNNPKTK